MNDGSNKMINVRIVIPDKFKILNGKLPNKSFFSQDANFVPWVTCLRVHI